jgi:hypothetical protein
VTVHTEESTSHLLKFYCSERKGFPFTCWFRLHLDNFGRLSYKTSLKENNHCHSVKQMVSTPAEWYCNAVFLVSDFDAPKWLADKVSHSKISVYYETQSRKLTGS